MTGQKVPPELDELGAAISRLEPPRAREAFRFELRARLVATAASEWSARRARPSLTPLLFTPRLAPALALLVVAMLVGGSGVVAAASLPGDAAYPLKLGLERVELALAGDDAGRAVVLARQSERRLDELSRVSETRPEAAPTATESYQATVERLKTAVAALVAAPPEEKREAALEVAEAAAKKHIAVLEELRKRHGVGDRKVEKDLDRALESALEEARELHERTKEKPDRKKRDDKKDERPGTAPAASPTRSPRPTAAPTPKPAGTPKPTETRKPNETPEPDETPEPEKTPKPGETPKPTSRP